MNNNLSENLIRTTDLEEDEHLNEEIKLILRQF